MRNTIGSLLIVSLAFVVSCHTKKTVTQSVTTPVEPSQGFWYCNEKISSVFEVHNSTDTNMLLLEVGTDNRDQNIPQIWGISEGAFNYSKGGEKIVVPPGKSIALGLFSNAAERYSSIRPFIEKHQSNPERIYFSVGDDVSVRQNLDQTFRWKQYINCPDSLLQFQKNELQVAKGTLSDSLSIESQQFQNVLDPKMNILGLVKLTNHSNHYVQILECKTQSDTTSIVGLPGWFETCDYEGIRIPPGCSVYLQYECNVIRTKYKSDISAFSREVFSENVQVTIKGLKTTKIVHKVVLYSENLRKRVVEVNGTSRQVYDIIKN